MESLPQHEEFQEFMPADFYSRAARHVALDFDWRAAAATVPTATVTVLAPRWDDVPFESLPGVF